MHPAHVPLHREPEPAEVRRSRHHRPRRRLLRDRERAGELRVHHGVQLAQEVDRLEVLAPAVAVRDPFAGIARVVEVEHRGHRVDAEPVEVELREPVVGAREQERPDLVPPVVEGVRAPVGMQPEARVRVLVERRAVEERERPGVAREVARHPVEDHPDAGPMTRIHERAQVVRRAVAAGRREEAGRLVAPRLVERVLGERQQLDVRVAQVDEVGHERVGELAVAVGPPVGMAAPGPRVHFVDAHRRVQPVRRGAALEPLRVAPRIPARRGDAARRARPHLRRARVRIGLEEELAGRAAPQLELVERALADARDEEHPHAARAKRAHHVRTAVPAIEVAHDARALRVRRPDREPGARRAVDLDRVRAEDSPGLAGGARVEEPQVLGADRRRERVRVDELVRRAARAHPEAGMLRRCARSAQLEERRVGQARERLPAAGRLGAHASPRTAGACETSSRPRRDASRATRTDRGRAPAASAASSGGRAVAVS